MLTASQLARRCGISRATLLYYESIGLLKPAARSAGNYRQYGERELERLRQIRAYRRLGLTLADIRAAVARPDNDATSVLKRRLLEINEQVETLRGHQRAILRLLQRGRSMRGTKMMTKDKWVGIMRAAGFDEDDMGRWHAEFERSAPEDHQQFLEYLQIPPDEIARIREYSRTGKEAHGK